MEVLLNSFHLNGHTLGFYSQLSGSPAKSGPLVYGTKNNFPSFFVREKGLANKYKKAIYYLPVSYFCFATSQNCILAKLRLPTVIRKVKLADFVKRATPLECSWRNFVFIQILRYIYLTDKISKISGKF